MNNVIISYLSNEPLILYWNCSFMKQLNDIVDHHKSHLFNLPVEKCMVGNDSFQIKIKIKKKKKKNCQLNNWLQCHSLRWKEQKKKKSEV